MNGRPEPVEKTVCDACEQSWDEHVKSSKSRARQLINEAVDYGNYETTADVPHIEPEVDFRDCIVALKNANRGPMGYTGPMGIQGEPGHCDC